MSDRESDLQVANATLAAAVAGLHRLQRILRWSIVLGLLALVAFGALLWRVYDLSNNQERDRCVSTNTTRSSIVEAFTVLADTFIGENPSEELVRRREAFFADMEGRFPIEDC